MVKSKSNESPAKASVKSATPPKNSFFSEFAGEGPVFYIRQFAGFAFVILGVVILATSYSEDLQIIPISPTVAVYVSLAAIIVGAILHEFRPWKVWPGDTLYGAIDEVSCKLQLIAACSQF
jgi:preprotein translocase subunit Sec61beta